ncbi:MAG: YHS domain-containing (seleno)protein [Litorimonas sp.]
MKTLSTNTLKTSLVATAALLGTLGALSAPVAHAADEVSITADAQASRLAVQGYDVVSYQTPGEPVVGAARFETEYEGATYRFSSQANLDTFTVDPARYVPAYGGFCAYGVAKGKKFDADPTAYTVENGQLYLNLNKKIQKKWLKKQDKYIDQAEANWPGIQNTAISDL